MEEQDDSDMAKSGLSPVMPNGFSCFDEDFSVLKDYQNTREDSEHVHDIKLLKLIAVKGDANYSNGYAGANTLDIPIEDGGAVFSEVVLVPLKRPKAEMHQLKRRLPFYNSETDQGNGVKKVEISGNNVEM